jgi:DMSO/TMAO reductase YedYZ molybdopterin-dependent catalytic subunit
VITLAIVAAVVGLIGRRNPRVAVGVTVVLLVVTGAAILGRTGAGILDLLPILIGGAAGIYFLVTVLRRQVVPAPVAATRPTDDPESASAAAAFTAGPLPADHAREAGPWDDAADPKRATTGSAHPMALATPGDGGRPGLDRRGFFKIVGIGALVAAAAGALARWIPSAGDVVASRAGISLPTPVDAQVVDVPGIALRVDGITPFVTDNAEFYRVDTAFLVPRITSDSWQLRVHGLVDREITLGYSDLTSMPTIERMITLTCVSNEVGGDLAGNARWHGVRIADVLAMAGPQAGADCVLSTSVDGFTVTTPLAALTDGRDAMLAFGMNGEPLPIEHGFPVRMVTPGLYGYVSATKWVVDLELTRFADVSAYWTDRGWAPQAPIKTASRIDVPGSFAQLTAGPVVVAGVAWAQHRGIAGVQVQIDDGEWQDATLSGDVSIDTWRQWSYEWQATGAGNHAIRCRAIDAAGEIQTDAIQGVMPDGSTGLDTRQVSVTA